MIIKGWDTRVKCSCVNVCESFLRARVRVVSQGVSLRGNNKLSTCQLGGNPVGCGHQKQADTNVTVILVFQFLYK